MRFLLLVLAACGPKTPPTPAPAPAPAPVHPAPADGLAPRLFDADQLRDGFVLGTKIRLRIEQAGQPTVEERWEVTDHTPEGCTIATKIFDPSTGALLDDQGEGTSTWTELEGHASFPAARTVISDAAVTVPGGSFTTRHYTVTNEDGTVSDFDFATTLPGPPVLMVVKKDGLTVMTMTLLERTHP